MEKFVKELSGRLAYGVKVQYRGEVYDLYMVGVEKSVIVKPFMSDLVTADNEDLKLCLRPMSSMSEREQAEYSELRSLVVCHNADEEMADVIDWLRCNQFDWNGLFEDGRAVEP